jgi:hypothetical protein
MFLALDVAFLVSLVGLPFTPFALGQAIIDVLPGWISIPLIELLHFWAKALLIIGVLALFMIAGAIAGVFAISSQRRDAAVLGAVAAPWIAAVVLGQVFAGAKIDLGTSVVDAAVGLAANALGLSYLAPAALARDTEPMPRGTSSRLSCWRRPIPRSTGSRASHHGSPRMRITTRSTRRW